MDNNGLLLKRHQNFSGTYLSSGLNAKINLEVVFDTPPNYYVFRDYLSTFTSGTGSLRLIPKSSFPAGVTLLQMYDIGLSYYSSTLQQVGIMWED